MIKETIIAYALLCDYDEDKLSGMVNDKISQGWQPFYAASISSARPNCQAVVKYKE